MMTDIFYKYIGLLGSDESLIFCLQFICADASVDAFLQG